jgi:hypothetical protein
MSRHHHHHREAESHSACRKTEELKHSDKLNYEYYGETTRDKPAQTTDTARTLPGLEVVEAGKTAELVQQKKAELEREYHIKFETPATSNYGDRVREPSLDELRGVEAALKKSRASVLQSSWGKGEMRLVFLKDQVENEPTAQNQQTPSGSRVVIFGNTGWAPTEKDVNGEKKNTKNSVSIENQLLHEFGHQAESSTSIDPEKMGWKKAG